MKRDRDVTKNQHILLLCRFISFSKIILLINSKIDFNKYFYIIFIFVKI